MAWVFVVWGVLAVVWLVVALARGQMPHALGVVALLIGGGLLQGRSLWRWVGLIFLPIVIINCVAFIVNAYRAPAAFPTPGIWAGVLALIALLCLTAVWMFRVLLRGDVRRFYAARAAATSASAGDFPLPR